MRVYRMENKRREGPFNDTDDSDYARLNDVLRSTVGTDYREGEEYPDLTGEEWLDRISTFDLFTKTWNTGTASEAAFNHWFPAPVVEHLAKRGFAKRVYEVPADHVKRGVHQLIFEPEYAEAVEEPAELISA